MHSPRFVFLFLLAAVISVHGSPATTTSEAAAAAQAECGGEGQRACTIFEPRPNGLACQQGLEERAGCTGDCRGSTGTCVRITPCGNEGQRACTVLGDDLQTGFSGCRANSNLIEIPQCTTAGECFGHANTTSSGMCVAKTECGGAGQRACTAGERFLSPCNEGLVEIAGCSGDCWAQGGQSTGMCTNGAPMTEPTTNATPAFLTPTLESCSLSGYMDMHMHMFADMAHGGGTLAGKPYDPVGGVNAALRADFTTTADLVYGNGMPLGVWSDAVDAVQTSGSFLSNFLQGLRISISFWITQFASCPASLFGIACTTQDYFHGPHDPLLGDPIGSVLGTQDGAGSNFGAPLFNGWPKWTSTTHQQVYYKWLERAWQGGLRMMTELAVTNEALCRGNKHLAGTNCEDSMAAIDAQIDAAYDFQTYVDTLSGGPGTGWYRIVKTPLEARVAIASGKLAVVLGIETAELFNCYERSTCSEQFIRDKVDEYYDKGIRHVFPIHNFDNAFGAAATWQDGIEVGQRLVEQRWWDTRDCGNEGYTFQLGTFTQTLIPLLKFSADIPEDPPGHPGTAHCNEKGLQPLGQVLMTALMDKGMIIDVDHMSALSFDQALELAEHRPGGAYSGITASHVLPRELHYDTVVGNAIKRTRHERLRTAAQLQRIRGVRGMIAAMLKDDGQDTGLKGERYTGAYGTRVIDDCRHSSRSFAQAYMYDVDQMGGPVALGSDFNGVAGHIGPRFGVEACGGNVVERNRQIRYSRKVQYPFTLTGFGTFEKQVTGQRTFDFNADGMAHVGMLPDFIQDLKAVEMPPAYLDAMFGSARAYVEMWERVTASTTATDDDTPAGAVGDTCAYVFTPRPPSVTATVTPPANAAGWHRTPPTVTWTVTSSSISPVASRTGCDRVTITTDTNNRVLTCQATTGAGLSASASVTIKLDQVAPSVTFGSPLQPANANDWHRQDVVRPFTVTDNLSGLPAGALAEGTITIASEGTGLTASVTAVDVAGNQVTATSPAVQIDKTPPAVTGTRVTPPNAAGWNNSAVTARFTAQDALSGLSGLASADVLLSSEGANQIASRTFTDRAGNTASANVTGISIDLTPPIVNGARAPMANANGWSNVDVTVSFACMDTLSGVAACSDSSLVATEGANQSRSGEARDLAGNLASATVGGISIDKTPPVINGVPDRAPNVNGWYNANIVVTFTCGDLLSGVNSCGPSPQVVDTEGMNLSRSATAVDRAGNTATATVGGLNLDKTPPVVQCGSSPTSLSPPNHQLVAIAATVTVADPGAPTVPGFTLMNVSSSEADNGTGDGDTVGDIQGFAIGTADLDGLLRAERSGSSNGRTYSLVYRSVDAAGNAGTCTATVNVPQ